LKVRVPADPCVRAMWSLNKVHRPGWEARVLAWAKKNGIELEA
jgi:hypothetical protein